MESRFLSPSSSRSGAIPNSYHKEAKMRPCWADLPGDLLANIAENASATNTQYVHLRAVCKAWRSSLTPHPHHLSPQFPWLMLPRPPLYILQRLGVSDAHVSFYNIAQSKTYQFQLPYMSGKYFCGSSHGWLVLEHEHEHRVSLLNPVTRGWIDRLPSLDSPPTLLRKMHVYVPSNQGYRCCIAKVILSCTPSKPGCVVVASFSYLSNWKLGFCRIGDSQWTELKLVDVGSYLEDITFYNKLVYTVNSLRKISVYDLQDGSVWTFPSKINFYSRGRDRINLVEGDADSGGPLIVRTIDCTPMDWFEENKVYVYKWWDDHQRWRRVKDIGKWVLFLNERYSIILQSDEKQENEVCYTERHFVTIDSFRVDINRANLESGEELPHELSPMEVFPSICGMPLWVTPSLI